MSVRDQVYDLQWKWQRGRQRCSLEWSVTQRDLVDQLDRVYEMLTGSVNDGIRKVYEDERRAKGDGS